MSEADTPSTVRITGHEMATLRLVRPIELNTANIHGLSALRRLPINLRPSSASHQSFGTTSTCMLYTKATFDSSQAGLSIEAPLRSQALKYSGLVAKYTPKRHKSSIPSTVSMYVRIACKTYTDFVPEPLAAFEFQWTFDIPRFARSLTAHNLNAVSSIRLQRDSIRSLIGGQGGVDAVHTLPSLERLHVRGYVWGPEWDELAMTRLRTDGKSISIFAD